MSVRLCLLGMPGSGKTTIAENLVEDLLVPFYDVGAILRSQASSDSHIAKIHKEGGLVNSNRVLGIFEQALENDNFLLCGSPRKANEAQFILNHPNWINNPGWLIHLELDVKLAKQRLISRKRFDDLDQDILDKRFEDFFLHTMESIRLFEQKDRVLTIDGSRSPKEIINSIKHFLKV